MATEWPALEAKLMVRYPNVPIPLLPESAHAPLGQGPVKLLFVGGHFARKGGCVLLRMAELAPEYGLDLEVNIVSSLTMGGGIWTDPLRPAYYDKWRALLGLPNVQYHNALPNADVLQLMRQADFSMLTTFSDTFGFSAIEAMAVGCPVIATRQAALPEFIVDGQTGIMLDFASKPNEDWIHSKAAERDQKPFEDLFDSEIDRLAHVALTRITDYVTDPVAYATLRAKARAAAIALFDAQDANRFWDDLYTRSV